MAGPLVQDARYSQRQAINPLGQQLPAKGVLGCDLALRVADDNMLRDRLGLIR